jgi:hypothetical protein
MKTDIHLDGFEVDSVTLQKVSIKATAFGSINVGCDNHLFKNHRVQIWFRASKV